MPNLLLPFGAQEIVAVRRNGLCPRDTIFVSVGEAVRMRRAYPENGHVFCGESIAIGRFDFSWVVGLHIEVAAPRIIAAGRAIEAMQAILDRKPATLVAWETSTGQRFWIADEFGAWPHPWPTDPDRSLMSAEAAA